MSPAWLVLLCAIGVEVGATAALPRTRGFHDPIWTGLVVSGYALSIWLLTVVVRDIPVSIAYAVWAGLGTAGIAAAGVVWLGETLNPVQILAIGLVVGGVVLLNLTATTH